MTNEIISVIIPVYEKIDALQICLEAIQNQTYLAKEIILVDDGSVAAAQKTISKLAQQFNVRHVVQDKHRGAPAARNAGAQIALGEFLFFCDADIKLEPSALADLINALHQNPAAAFSYGDFISYNGIVMRGQEFSLAALKTQNFISTMSLVRRSAFPGFDEALKRFQDWDLWLTISQQGQNGVYVPKNIFTVCAAGEMSRWVPSFLIKHHRFFHWLPRVRSYFAARKIIEQKHDLAAE